MMFGTHYKVDAQCLRNTLETKYDVVSLKGHEIASTFKTEDKQISQ